jgi:putative Holliday junction resolvase
MALDVSAQRIGLAVTDPGRTIALPMVTLTRGKWIADTEVLLGHIQERRIGGLIIGLPLLADGRIGAQAQSRLTFASNLDKFLAKKRLSLPYVMVDESLTSHAADELLARRGNKKNAQDQWAAVILLQQFLKI